VFYSISQEIMVWLVIIVLHEFGHAAMIYHYIGRWLKMRLTYYGVEVGRIGDYGELSYHQTMIVLGTGVIIGMPGFLLFLIFPGVIEMSDRVVLYLFMSFGDIYQLMVLSNISKKWLHTKRKDIYDCIKVAGKYVEIKMID